MITSSRYTKQVIFDAFKQYNINKKRIEQADIWFKEHDESHPQWSIADKAYKDLIEETARLYNIIN